MFYLLRTGMTWKIIITRRRMIDLKIKISVLQEETLVTKRYYRLKT